MKINTKAFLVMLLLSAFNARAQAPAPSPSPIKSQIPAANYVVVGNVYYDQGKYDQAYVAFRAATEIDPVNKDGLLGLGRSQAKLRLFAPAIETFKALIKADSKGISGYIALAQAYEQQYISSSDRSAVKDNLDNALAVLKDAELLTTPQDTPERKIGMSKVLNERGNAYKLKGDGGAAITSYQQASLMNPDNGLILYNLGDMYAAAGDYTKAIASLQNAVIADPRDAYSRAYYAKLLATTGNTVAARPEAIQAVKLAPKNAYAVGQYGVVSYLAKDPSVAKAQLSQAVQLDPLRYPEFYYYLGRVAIDAGELKDARSNLTKAAALASSTPEYFYYLGVSYERSTPNVSPDKLKAKENYEKAISLQPDYQLAIEALARVK